MKKLATIIIALATMVSPMAVLAKNIQKAHPIKAFEKLEASNAVTITYIQGTPVGLKISGSENAVATLKIKQVGQKLKIWRENNRYSQNEKVSITITTPALKEVELSGACKFNAKRLSRNGSIELDLYGASAADIGQLQGSDIDIECSGASRVNVAQTSASKCDLDLTGASTITMGGSVSNLNIECSGASKAELSKLAAKTGSVKASGASSVKSRITTLSKSDSREASTIQNR